jgi:lipoprotein NlpD
VVRINHKKYVSLHLQCKLKFFILDFALDFALLVCLTLIIYVNPHTASRIPSMTNTTHTLSKPVTSALPALLATLLLAACSSTPMTSAPVVERSVNGVAVPSNSYPSTSTTGTSTTTNRPAATGSTANGGTYTGAVVSPRVVTTTTTTTTPTSPVIDGRTHVVKKGDTLYSIALENGVGYRELAEWNGISNPSYIQIDQVLRVTAPNGALSSGTGSAGGAVGSVAQSAPIAMPSGGAVVGRPTTTATTTTSTPTTSPTPPANTPTAVDGDLTWQWPARGKASSYVEGRSKGVDIAGNMGDAITAAADGKVVYAGSALKGYGQMLIVKHSEVYLTAYAHNSKLLVREEQLVKRGQKIAEMGNSESDNGQIKLHFELRRSGKPVDPARILPPQ